MKKTILASAILLVAGAANAAEVYNNEGATVTLGGSFRGHVQINDSDDVQFQDAGTRFDVQATKDLGNGLKVLGVSEIKYTDIEDAQKDADGNKVVLRDAGLYLNKAYVGLEHDVYGTMTLGRQYGLNDDLVLNDFSYEQGIYNEDNDKFGSDSEEQLKYVKAFGGASIVVSLMDQDTYAIGGTYEVAGLTVGGSYNIANDRNGFDNSTYILGAQYAIDALTVGANYQASEFEKSDSSSWGIGAKYAMGQASAYAMYDVLTDDVKKNERSEMVLGADYELAEGVIAYTEFVLDDKEIGSSDEKLTIGGRFYF